MNFALAGAAAIAVLAGFAFFFLFRRLISRGGQAHTDLDWCRDFSIAKYRPMERLFVEEDYEFLAAQPGFHPKLYRKLQAERRRVFRHYLRCLSRDFDRLIAAAKILMVHAPQDRPELAGILFKQRIAFSYALLVVHAQLQLQAVGIGRVDVRRLVGSLELVRDQLRQLSQRVQPSASIA